MRQPCGSRRSGWMSPPWRSTIHCAMARPRPAPPSRGRARGVGAVEALEDARLVGLGDAGAFVEHLDGDAGGVAAGAHLDRCRRVGVWRTAFSSRLATTWCTRSGSPSAVRSGESTDTDTAISGACSCCSRTACSSSGSTRNSVRSSGTTPDSRRERSRSCLTRRPSRSTWASIVRNVSGSGSVTPSTRFSSTACSAVIGVRSSCDTLATRSRRTRSVSASSAAIWLNARASSPTSSRDDVETRRL